MTTAATITIEELTPAGTGLKPRSLLLSDSTMPLMGAGWRSEQRMKTTWYPGSSEASQQVLGASYMPSSWPGEWRRHHMGKRPAVFKDENGVENFIVSPHILAQIFDSICRAGQKLRVIFAVDGTSQAGTGKSLGDQTQIGRTVTEKVRITRVGRMKAFDIQVQTHQIIGWTAEFEWSGNGLPVKPVTIEGAGDDNGVATLLATQTGGFTGLPKIEQSLSLAKLEKIANTPKKLLSDALTDIGNKLSNIREASIVAKKIATTPREVAQGVAALAKSSVETSKRCADEFGGIPAELISTNDNVTDVTAAVLWKARRQAEMNRIAAAAREVQRRAEKVAGPNVETKANRIHVARKGDTPANVAQQYYGDSSQGLLILQANGLPWHLAVFAPGKVLVIPDGGTVRK